MSPATMVPETVTAPTRASVRREVHEAIDALMNAVAEASKSPDDASLAARADASQDEVVDWIEAYADVSVSTDMSVKRRPYRLDELVQTPALLAATSPGK